MNKLAQAISNEFNDTVTENGMGALKSTTSKCVDLFFSIGAMRGQNIIPAFAAAFAENPNLAVRIALWARDVREGAGERQIFRDICSWLEILGNREAQLIIPKISEIGRWDDLLVFNILSTKKIAFEQIRGALMQGNGLCAKWMPRKGPVAEELTKYFNLTPRKWRKLLVNTTKVVEQQMCAKDWNHIEFGKVPSIAAKRYQKAFLRNATDNYNTYLSKLSSGEEKVNAAAIYPHQVVQGMHTKEGATLALAQWEALPNYMGSESILPMVDVSGSMAGANVLDIAVALGLYVADKGKGPFKDCFLTFSGKPKLHHLSGNIIAKYNQMERADWDMNTNISAAFAEILLTAVRNRVSAEDMPRYLLILSDMQFDQCTTFDNVYEARIGVYPNNIINPMRAMQVVSSHYQQAGYQVPKIVFWNLADRGNNIPVKFSEDGVALVSGFSPSIMKSVLKAENFNPQAIMLDTVMRERYDF